MTTKQANRRKGGTGKPITNKSGSSRADRKADTAARVALALVKATASTKTANKAKEVANATAKKKPAAKAAPKVKA